MLQLKTVTPQFADFDKVSALYHSAFPENERRPLEEMFTFLSGGGEFLALYDRETFCGFVCSPGRTSPTSSTLPSTASCAAGATAPGCSPPSGSATRTAA